MKLSQLLSDFPELELVRDGDFNVTGSNDSTHDEAILSYIYAERYLSGLCGSVSCVITDRELADRIPSHLGVAVAERPKEAFFRIHNALAEGQPEAPATVVGQGCRISPRAMVAERGVVIGDGVTIEEGAIVKSGTIIGNGCVLRSGVIVGGEGFQFAEIGGIPTFITHLGGVELGECVELQQNTVVDRAVWLGDRTVIGRHTKVNGLCKVEHGSKLGDFCTVTAGVTLGGHVTAGDRVYFGAGAAIKNHITIGDGAVIGMGAVVIRDVPAGQTVAGNPARALAR